MAGPQAALREGLGRRHCRDRELGCQSLGLGGREWAATCPGAMGSRLVGGQPVPCGCPGSLKWLLWGKSGQWGERREGRRASEG